MCIRDRYGLMHYKGIYENEAIQFKRGGWRFFTFHSLSLNKTTKFTMNGFFILNGSNNFYELKNFGQLNFGLQKNLLNNKLSITLNAQDVLRTMRVHFKLDQASILSTGNRYSDSQRFGINLRYNFGFSPQKNKNLEQDPNSQNTQDIEIGK